jgi:hypothetical protein
MLTRKEKPKYQLLLESELEHQLKVLKGHVSGSEEYVKTLSQVERLHGMIDEEKHSIVSKDALLNVGANLLGILMIIKHEHVNVITSKALSFVIRPR